MIGMTLRLSDTPASGYNYQPGDCWYAKKAGGRWTWFGAENWPVSVVRDLPEGKRPAIVVLPNGRLFCVHSPTMRGGKAQGHGWTVTGELPTITVRPSINYAPGTVDAWHGFITDGEMRSV